MTARITPQQNFSQEPSQQSLQDQDEQQSTNFDEYYVPEREFVLMPLFRRIGRMLGFKQADQMEYIYAPETVQNRPYPTTEAPIEQLITSQTENVAEAPAFVPQVEPNDGDLAGYASGETWYTPAQDFAGEPVVEEHASEVSQSPDILGIEPELQPVNEFAAVEENTAELHGETDSREAVIEPALQQMVEAAAETVAMEAHPYEARAEETPVEAPALQAEPETLVTTASAAEVPHPISAPAALSAQETSDLVTQMREAATKLSAAVAQAAQWLHTKEEEILRRAEMPLAPEPHLHEEHALSRSGEAPRATATNNRSVSEWEATEVPELQRERAWEEERPRPFAVLASGAQRTKKVEQKRGWTATSLLGSWRSIDWAQQFAPKRVAILGGVLMAILMILGISFARRPASNDLPQQTRAIEPGGVTVTTHPQIAPAPVARAEKKTVVAKENVEPHRTRRSSVADNEPDVVTHYYNQKPKPSPSHPMTAAAGVRHYSDMQ